MIVEINFCFKTFFSIFGHYQVPLALLLTEQTVLVDSVLLINPLYIYIENASFVKRQLIINEIFMAS